MCQKKISINATYLTNKLSKILHSICNFRSNIFSNISSYLTILSRDSQHVRLHCFRAPPLLFCNLPASNSKCLSIFSCHFLNNQYWALKGFWQQTILYSLLNRWYFLSHNYPQTLSSNPSWHGVVMFFLYLFDQVKFHLFGIRSMIATRCFDSSHTSIEFLFTHLCLDNYWQRLLPDPMHILIHHI